MDDVNNIAEIVSEPTLENNQEVAETTLQNNHEDSNLQGTADNKYKWNESQENLRNLRAIAEQNAWRAQQAEARLAEMEKQHKQPSEYDDLEETDDIVDKRELKKQIKKINARTDKSDKEIEQLRKENQYYQTLAAKEHLKGKFPGWDKVVNDKNLKLLEEEDPVLYNSIISHRTYLEQGDAAYKILKPYLAEKHQTQSVREKLEDNKSKPKSAAIAGGKDSDVTALANFQDKKRWKVDLKYK